MTTLKTTDFSQITIEMNRMPDRIWYVRNPKTGETVLKDSRREIREVRAAWKASGINAVIGSYKPAVESHG